MISILDDSPSVIAILNDILDNLGYAVTSACNGQEAYTQVENTHFNMIVTDLKMPVMDGFEFVKRAKQLSDCKFVPMVILSSEENEDKIAEARRAGVSTFTKNRSKEVSLQQC